MKNLRTARLMTFAVIGAIFLFCGVAIHQISATGGAGMISVESKVLSVTDEDVLLEYSVNGRAYQGYATVYSVLFRPGKTYRLMVDPDHPERISGPALDGLAALFACAGMLLIAVGIAAYLHTTRRIREMEHLFVTGIRQQGTITAAGTARPTGNQFIRFTSNIEAECVHPLTGRTVRLLRPMLNDDLRVGEPIDILFDPTDENRYIFAFGKNDFM